MRRKAKPLCANFAALASRSLVITCVVGHLVAVPTFSSAPKLNHQHQHQRHHYRHRHRQHINVVIMTTNTTIITVKTIITTIIITLIPGHLVAAPPLSSAPVPHQ